MPLSRESPAMSVFEVQRYARLSPFFCTQNKSSAEPIVIILQHLVVKYNVLIQKTTTFCELHRFRLISFRNMTKFMKMGIRSCNFRSSCSFPIIRKVLSKSTDSTHFFKRLDFKRSPDRRDEPVFGTDIIFPSAVRTPVCPGRVKASATSPAGHFFDGIVHPQRS